MGLIGFVLCCAPAFGPIISGVIIDALSWRALFLCITIVSCFLLLTINYFVSNYNNFEKSNFDIISMLLITFGMSLVIYSISIITSFKPLWAPILLLCLGIFLLITFYFRQQQLKNPILQIRLFEIRNFSITGIITTLLQGILIASTVVFPLYLQNTLSLSAIATGLIMLPGGIISAFISFITGKIFDNYGVRGISFIGCLFLLIGSISYIFFTYSTSLILIIVFYSLACIGIQILITTINTWGITTLSNTEIPHSNAILSTLEQIGASFGTIFVTSLTALAPLVMSTNTENIALSAMENHLSFIGIAILASTVLAITLLFVINTRSTLNKLSNN